MVHSTLIISFVLLILGTILLIIGLVLHSVPPNEITQWASVFIVLGILIMMGAIAALIISFDYTRKPVTAQVQEDINNGNIQPLLT